MAVSAEPDGLCRAYASTSRCRRRTPFAEIAIGSLCSGRTPMTGPGVLWPRRRCPECHGAMMCTAEEFSGVSTRLSYSCERCGHSKELSPAGAAGAWLAIWIMASAIVAVLAKLDKNGPSLFVWAFYGLIWFGGAWAVAWPAIQQLRYPVVPGASQPMHAASDRDLLRRGIRRIERMGFWKTPAMIVLSVVALLGLATIVGLVIDAPK